MFSQHCRILLPSPIFFKNVFLSPYVYLCLLYFFAVTHLFAIFCHLPLFFGSENCLIFLSPFFFEITFYGSVYFNKELDMAVATSKWVTAPRAFFQEGLATGACGFFEDHKHGVQPEEKVLVASPEGAKEFQETC